MTVLLTLSTFAKGEDFQDHVHSIELGQDGQEHLLLLESGRVAFFNPLTSPYYQPSDFETGSKIKIELNEDLTIKSVQPLLPSNDFIPHSLQEEQIQKEATILPDYASAKKIFDRMNRSYKTNTECSDRAHVWSYEEYKKNNLYTNKSFIFFTNTYIRKYRFKWWFHVAPYTLVREHGEIVEHVLDRKYTSYPYHMKQWTDVFMRSKKECPVKTYAHYRANKNGTNHCFLVKSSMYYRLPLHIRGMEDNGTIKTNFSQSEVNFSYRTFRNRLK